MSTASGCFPKFAAKFTLTWISVVLPLISRFDQALHLAVATAEYYHVVGIGENGHMDVGSNLKSCPYITITMIEPL